MLYYSSLKITQHIHFLYIHLWTNKNIKNYDNASSVPTDLYKPTLPILTVRDFETEMSLELHSNWRHQESNMRTSASKPCTASLSCGLFPRNAMLRHTNVNSSLAFCPLNGREKMSQGTSCRESSWLLPLLVVLGRQKYL